MMTVPGKGVVAAGHEVTAAAAAEILHDGGNAFDAVLAGLFAACVPETVLASIGGGGFLMAYDAADDRTLLYDFFVDTPLCKRSTPEIDFRVVEVDFGPATQDFHVGVGATATPGFIPGVLAVHKDLCRLPMTRIVEPAARVAREGVVMNDFQSYLFSIIPHILADDPAAAAIHAPGGKLLQSGDVYRNPAFADTLEALAHEGADLFVNGDIGQEIVRLARDEGGHLAKEDLQAYRVRRRAPLAWNHNGNDIFLNPAPAASGPLIAFGLGLLEGLGSASAAAPDVLDMAEVMKATVEARSQYDDRLERLADRDLIAAQLERLARIPAGGRAYRGTTHISVVDGAGNAAAATVSNGEGNGRMLGRHGFMLNNMLGEEDLNPNGFHRWPPGQRMSTMMAPTIIRESDGALTALGSGGSNRIRTAVLQVACNLLDRGMTLDEAVAAPRLHIEKCGKLSFEDQMVPEARAALLSAFPDAHPWPEPNMFFGGVHSARRARDGTFTGAGDARRAGVARVV